MNTTISYSSFFMSMQVKKVFQNNSNLALHKQFFYILKTWALDKTHKSSLLSFNMGLSLRIFVNTVPVTFRYISMF